MATAFTAEKLQGLLKELMVWQGLMDLPSYKGPVPEGTEDLRRCVSDETLTRAVMEVTARSLPQTTAPGGLGGVTLPDDANGIVAVLERLPSEIASKARVPQLDETGPDRYSTGYGQESSRPMPLLQIQAMDVSTGEFYPSSWTAEHVIAVLAQGHDWQVMATGRDGDLVWVQWTTTGNGYQTYVITWGNIGSPWMFSGSANTPEGLGPLVAAFVAAAGTAGRP